MRVSIKGIPWNPTNDSDCDFIAENCTPIRLPDADAGKERELARVHCTAPGRKAGGKSIRDRV